MSQNLQHTCKVNCIADVEDQAEHDSLERALLRSARRSRGRPYSAACPWSMTRMVSPSMTVCRRCAMAISVQSLNSVRIVFWMRASVSTSTKAVASSSTRICTDQSQISNRSGSAAHSRSVQVRSGLHRCCQDMSAVSITNPDNLCSRQLLGTDG